MLKSEIVITMWYTPTPRSIFKVQEDDFTGAEQ